ncbi:MAG: DUF1361 domain-containing protein [Sandaracinaceae bacterium]|nr:DUF1361 domain-containing protein [Sandaracinaceae bacterium]
MNSPRWRPVHATSHRHALGMLFLRILPLGLFSVLALALLVARVVFTQNSVFLVFAWNLFLAWVPLALALGLERASRLGSASLLGVAWLAFFPNAPYLVTDLVHLRHRAPVPLWYDVAFFATLALAGLFVGLASLEIVHRVLRRHVSARAAWALVLLISALSGYAIYLGRFLRWNSWDLFTRPLGVLASVASDVTHARPWGVSVVFGAIVFASYVAYWGRQHGPRGIVAASSETPPETYAPS